MAIRFFHAWCVGLALALAASAAPPPVAAQSAGDTIKMRVALMKENGGHLKAIVAYLKNGVGTPADLVGRGKALAGNASKIPALFPTGTGMDDGVGQTRAKAAIWTDRAKFEAAAGGLRTAATRLAEAAQSGDKKAIGTAFTSLRAGCGGCHKDFRQKKKQ